MCIQSRTEQELTLWVLVNPKLKRELQAAECKRFLDELATVAIEFPLRFYLK